MFTKKLKYLMLVACCGLLFIAYAYDPTKITRGLIHRENFLQNRPTSYWRELLQRGMEDDKLQQRTINTLNDRYANPVLRDCLSDSDPKVRWASLMLFAIPNRLNEIKLLAIEFLDDPDVGVRCTAISTLEGLGHEASPAVWKLIRLATHKNRKIAFAAQRALWKINRDEAIRVGNWREFKSDYWNWSVILAGSPIESKTYVQTLHGQIPMQITSVDCGIAFVTIGVCEFPATGVEEDISPDDSYAYSEEQATEGAGGVLVNSEVVSQRGPIDFLEGTVERFYEGRQLTIDVAGECRMFHRVFFVGKRQYQLNVAFPEDRVSQDAAEYILNSFQIDYSPEQ